MLLAVGADGPAMAQEACDRPDPLDGYSADHRTVQGAEGDELEGYAEALQEYLDCLGDERDDAEAELERVAGEWEQEKDVAAGIGYR